MVLLNRIKDGIVHRLAEYLSASATLSGKVEGALHQTASISAIVEDIRSVIMASAQSAAKATDTTALSQKFAGLAQAMNGLRDILKISIRSRGRRTELHFVVPRHRRDLRQGVHVGRHDDGAARGYPDRDGPARRRSHAEFKLDVPGDYTLVDHAIARMERGLLGVLHVEGTKNPEIYNGEVMPGMGH